MRDERVEHRLEVARSRAARPVAQDRTDEPAGQGSGPPRRRRILDARAQEAFGERDGADHPLPLAPNGTEAPLPVESWGSAFDAHGQVNEPDGPEDTVAQRVNGEQPKVVLWAENPRETGADRYRLGSLSEMVESERVDPRGAVVNVDWVLKRRRGRQRPLGSLRLSRTDNQIEVGVGTEPDFKIPPSHGPALDE